MLQVTSGPLRSPSICCRCGASRIRNGLATLRQASPRCVICDFVDRPEVVGREREVGDSLRREAHDPRDRGVDGRQVRADDDQTHRLAAAHDRAVAFHAVDAVDDREQRRQRGVDVVHRFGNAVLMQHVFGPAVLQAGEHAVEILHAGGEAHPMVRFHLRQRDDEIGLDDALREPEAGELAAPAAVRLPGDGFVVEIGKRGRRRR